MSKYTIDGSTLTAIANSVRSKLNITDSITPEQMAMDIMACPPASYTVSDYVRTEALRVVELVKAKMNSNTVTFLCLADTHVLATDTTNSPTTMAGLHSAVTGARIIKEVLPLDFTTVLGDISAGTDKDTREVHLTNHMESRKAMSILQPTVVIEGNHDRGYNEASWLGGSELYDYVGKYNNNVVRPSSAVDRGYCYIDIESKKTRAIFMNTSDLRDKTASSHGSCYISADQFRWLISTLSEVGAKSGWNVLILSHHPLHWDATSLKVATILDAYNLGTSGSISADGATISYSFSGKNLAKILCNIHGHTHNFITGTVGDTQVVRIGTPNAYFYRNNEYGSATDYPDAAFREKFGDTKTYNKSKGTATDTAFCVYVIDTVARSVHAFCYGAGYDRSLGLDTGALKTITYNLTGVTSDNTTTLIAGNQPYVANITATGVNKIRSHNITMDGKAVTPSSVGDTSLTINIPSVSGDISITVVATAYLNQVTTSKDSNGNIYNGTGYKWGYRLNSNGTETQMTQNDEGGTVSGFIPYKGEVIRIAGSWSYNLSDTGWYVMCYNSSFTKTGGFACSNVSDMTTFAAHPTIKTYDGKTSYIWTIDPSRITNSTYKSQLTSATYIRVSAPRCYGSDLRCSLNEEIIE